MIDPKELRVGNFVKCITHLPIGYFHPTLLYSEVMEIRGESIETTVSTHKYKEIAPIELTKDILLNSGGFSLSDNEITFSENDLRTPILYILLNNGEFYLSINNQCRINNPITSVHHFQNIYYDIMGKEIEIKIPENPI
ncbi:MAG: hypothetical protein LBV43_15055 [Prevotella sp.]|jgi:hypothetical protein|nr:hypothetical protein [Prevotella sp.]